MAQRLAQSTHNRQVAGSNPAGPTSHAYLRIIITFRIVASDYKTLLPVIAA